jgi:trigger factor
MANELTDNPEAPATEATTTQATADEGKLPQTVEIKDVGPCKKHIKVVVDRKAIDERLNEQYTKLVRSDESQINGFRPGKAPRKIIERRFKSSVFEQVRQEVLMASLEQLATENQISPLAPPDLDIDKLEIPEEGDFVYEFDIEVRPEFDLPTYKGLKLKRPVKTFTQADIDKEIKRLLEPSGQLVPKEGADVKVELNDFIVADVVMTYGEQELNKLSEVRVRVEKRFALSDGVSEDFGKVMKGAKAGDVRNVDIKLKSESVPEALQGATVQAQFTIKDIKVVRVPEIDQNILERHFGVKNIDQLHELVEVGLNRRLEYIQRQSFRQQIMEGFVAASQWDLPHDLLVRQAKRTLQRRALEMRNGGMDDDQIKGRLRLLEQDVVKSTAQALKEHFILQKIAEEEKIEITDQDIDDEIDRIADRTDETPRKVRAKLEKDQQIETLATELLERQALDIVLANAEYEDVELKSEDEEGDVATVSEGAVPDSMENPSPTSY